MHVDMDAFFAAVEERNRPRLKGRPIVVGADPKGGRGRGVVSTANYKARDYGIRSAMPISLAWRLAKAAEAKGEPAAVFIGGSFAEYEKVSCAIMEYLRPLGDAFEQASVDEAYLDVSSRGSFEAATTLARAIKDHVKSAERLSCSIGIGPNKMVAKIASDAEKPDGLTVIAPERVRVFLDLLPVRKIPGIGPKSEKALLAENVHTVRDLRLLPEGKLEKLFGKWGKDMARAARGADESEIAESHEAKSFGAQETFERDTLDAPSLVAALTELACGVFRETKKEDVGFRGVTLTVRFADFETKTRSCTLPAVLADEKAFAGEALKLLLPFLDARENPKRKPIRLLGVRAERLAGELG